MNNLLEYYANLPYRVEIYPEENGQGYTAAIPDLPGCISSGDTPQEALHAVDEAKRLWLEVALQDGDPIPEPTAVTVEHFSGKFVVRVPRSLHRRLVKRAEVEGVSLNQLVVSILSESAGTAPSPGTLVVHLQSAGKSQSKREFTWFAHDWFPQHDFPVPWGAPIEVEEVGVLPPPPRRTR